MKPRLLPLLCLALLPAAAFADDLLSVYRQALETDPQYRAAIQAHEAAIEIYPQRRAALLPSLGLSADVSRNRFDPRDSGDRSYATNETYSVGLRQTLFNVERFMQFSQADNRVAEADARLLSAQQDLLLRVATRYFLVLGALDNLEFVTADKAAIGRTLEQANARFEVGLSAITDKLEAQARYDFAVSEEINAQKLLADAREALRELTGELPEAPEVLQAEIPLLAPEPDDKEQWVNTATRQNPLVVAALANAEASKQEVQVQRAGHYPTLDMTADYSYRDNRFGGFEDLKRNDSAIGVEMNLPLYQGGLVSSRTRQSTSEYNRALEDLEKQQRATQRQTRDNFRGINSNINRVQALKNAVASNEKAVEAAETGFEVGTRTIIDVLDAQRELLRARRDHARARYDYLLDTLRLKQAAGILQEDDLAQINEWLEPVVKE